MAVCSICLSFVKYLSVDLLFDQSSAINPKQANQTKAKMPAQMAFMMFIGRSICGGKGSHIIPTAAINRKTRPPSKQMEPIAIPKSHAAVLLNFWLRGQPLFPLTFPTSSSIMAMTMIAHTCKKTDTRGHILVSRNQERVKTSKGKAWHAIKYSSLLTTPVHQPTSKTYH